MEHEPDKLSIFRSIGHKRGRRQSGLLLLLLFFSLWLLGRYRYNHASLTHDQEGYAAKRATSDSLRLNATSTNAYSSWQGLANALEVSKPKGGIVVRWQTDSSVEANISLESEKQIEAIDFLHMSQSSMKAAQTSHKIFMDHIRKGKLKLEYKDESRGIVIAATNARTSEVLVSLRLLRRTGSTLPVEIFFPADKDLDAVFCSTAIRRLNARCLSMGQATSGASMPRALNSRLPRALSYDSPLYKYLCIFASNFEQVIFLEASTLVFNDPTSIFREEPFLSKGLIMWPDFWSASPSKLLLQVQNGTQEPMSASEASNVLRERGKNRNVKLSQLVISKRLHGHSLLLAIFYSFYGPGLYDDMIQQGSYGVKGDSSILASANHLKKEHYMITRMAEAAGFPDEDSKGKPFHFAAMVFYSPKDNYQRRRPDWHLPYFVSSVGIMADARQIYESGTAVFTSGGRKQSHRLWEWFSARNLPNGWRVSDPELALWQEMVEIVCNYARYFSEEASLTDTTKTCTYAKQHMKALWPRSV